MLKKTFRKMSEKINCEDKSRLTLKQICCQEGILIRIVLNNKNLRTTKACYANFYSKTQLSCPQCSGL